MFPLSCTLQFRGRRLGTCFHVNTDSKWRLVPSDLLIWLSTRCRNTPFLLQAPEACVPDKPLTQKGCGWGCITFWARQCQFSFTFTSWEWRPPTGVLVKLCSYTTETQSFTPLTASQKVLMKRGWLSTQGDWKIYLVFPRNNEFLIINTEGIVVI